VCRAAAYPGRVAGSRDATATGRVVLRPVLPRVLVVLVVLFGVWWFVDLVARGDGGSIAIGALWFAALVSVLVALFWLPAVVVDGDGVELRNVVRAVRVPWGALQDVDTRYALTLVAGGRRHQSWAAPSKGRPPRPRPSDLPRAEERWTPASRHDRSASGVAAALIERRRQEWREAIEVRARLAARTPGAAARPAEAPEPADVAVRWTPVAPAAAAVALASATVVTVLVG
jgi:Bacterial PH domain